MQPRAIILSAFLLAACGQSQPQSNPNGRLLIPDETVPAPKPPQAPPPRPPIDPKSAMGGEAFVRGFAALLNAHKFDEAYMLLGPAAPPRAEFEELFSAYSRLNVVAGAASGEGGAAGSIYLKVPLTVSGQVDGKRAERRADVVLRRVNDVPGSTDAQRRWHIERIDWEDTGTLAR